MKMNGISNLRLALSAGCALAVANACFVPPFESDDGSSGGSGDTGGGDGDDDTGGGTGDGGAGDDGTSDGGTGATNQTGGGGGGGGTGGTGGGPVIEDGPHPSVFSVDSYGESGAWHGDVFGTFEFTGTTMTPAASANQFPGRTVCVSGSLAGDYEAYAMIGFNLNQAPGGVRAPGVMDASRSGVGYKVLNNGTNPLRLQLEGAATDERWCANITSLEGVVAWSDFRKECWTGVGPAFDPSADQVTTIHVQAPSQSNTTAAPYDFCVIDLYEAP